jgi:CelD/BcsL family acetyltransferase involved in cellulose biosynthesis
VRGRRIAFEFALEEKGVYYLLKLGFDVGYAKYAPGKVLTHALVKRAFEHKLTSYELLGGKARLKTVGSADVRERVDLQAFAPTVLGVANWAVFSYGRPLAKRVLRWHYRSSESDASH